MKSENVRIKPASRDGGPCRTHAQRDPDYTLCGFTLDGDEDSVEWQKETKGPITCEQCWAIIEFCRTVKQKKIAFERGRKA